MTRSNLYRWGGLATIVGGIVLAVGELLHPKNEAANVTTSLWVISHELILVSLVLSIAGLFAVYTRQNREVGSLGFIGFLLAYVTMLSFIGIVYFEAFFNPVLAAQVPEFVQKMMSQEPSGTLGAIFLASGLLFSLGWLLFGFATLRARIFPRWGAILALVGGAFLGLEPLLPQSIQKVPAVVFGLALVWLGYFLWSER